MKSFFIENDDLSISSGRINMVCDTDEEVQAVERLLNTNVTEWFLNVEHGLEYEKIRGKNVTDEAIQMAVLKALAQEKRIHEVVSIDIFREEPYRTVRITILCKMISGNTVNWRGEYNV